jgi:hypothetical protein
MSKLWVHEEFDEADLATYRSSRPHPAHLWRGFANDRAATLELRGKDPDGGSVTWRYDLSRAGARGRSATRGGRRGTTASNSDMVAARCVSTLPMSLIPILLALLLSPELAVTPATLVPTPFTHGAAVAANGDRALAVWEDFRETGDIYGARIDAAGNVLDPTGLRLFHGQAAFAAAPSPDGGWLVAVQNTGGDGYAILVTRDGTVSPPKKIGSVAAGASSLQLATNGETFLLLLGGTRAFLLGLDGNVVAGPLLVGPGFGPYGAVASDGRDYLVATTSNGGTTLTPISRAGAAGTPHLIFAGYGIAAVTMASDGTRYFVAASAPPGTILTAFASADGTLIGVEHAAQQLYAFNLSAVSDGRDFGLIWTVIAPSPNPQPLLYGAPVDAFGNIANPQFLGRRVTGDGGIALTSLGGSVLIVRGEDFRLFGAFTTIGSLNGPLLPDFPIAQTAAAETAPVLTATSSGAVVLWRDFARSAWRAETLDGAGRPSGRIIDVAGTAAADQPHATFDGTNVVLSWRVNGVLFAQRYDASLQPLDAQPIRIFDDVNTFTAAGGSGATLFAWSSNGATGQHGAILTRGGDVVPVALPQVPVPAAAWNGSGFLVAYAFATGPPPTQGLFPDPPADIRTLRVAPDGTVLDAAPHTIAHLTTYVDELAAASNGAGFLVAWRPDLYQRFGLPSVIAGVSVNADGTAADPTPRPLSPDGVTQGPYLTAFDHRYALAWLTRPALYTDELWWRMVDADSAAALPPMRRAYYGNGAAIAAIGEQLELAYSRIDDSAGSVERVFVRGVTAPGRRRVAR